MARKSRPCSPSPPSPNFCSTPHRRAHHPPDCPHARHRRLRPPPAPGSRRTGAASRGRAAPRPRATPRVPATWRGHPPPLRFSLARAARIARKARLSRPGPGVPLMLRFRNYTRRSRSAPAEKAMGSKGLPALCGVQVRRAPSRDGRSPFSSPLQAFAQTAEQIRSTSASVKSGWIGSARIRLARSSDTGNVVPSCASRYAGWACSGRG